MNFGNYYSGIKAREALEEIIKVIKRGIKIIQ